MRPFAYERPDDAGSAVAMLAERPDARFLAGGTNLVDLMRLEVETPDLLVDVRRLRPIGRLGYREYVDVTDSFTMTRPGWQLPE